LHLHRADAGPAARGDGRSDLAARDAAHPRGHARAERIARRGAARSRVLSIDARAIASRPRCGGPSGAASRSVEPLTARARKHYAHAVRHRTTHHGKVMLSSVARVLWPSLAALSAVAIVACARPEPEPPARRADPAAQDRLARMPVAFVPNVGQWDHA